MSPSSACDMSKSHMLQSMILRRAALIKNQDIASVCKRDDSWVSRVLACEAGIRIDQLADFLSILGFKVCDRDALTVDRERYNAITYLALTELQRATGREE